EFKQRFIGVLKDLQANGKNDGEAMWLLGSLAARLIENARQATWTDLKAALTSEQYDGLLRDFQNEGNALHQQGGKGKVVYAIQILGVSLIAKTQTDEQLRTGEELLDGIIDYAADIYRKNRHLATK